MAGMANTASMMGTVAMPDTAATPPGPTAIPTAG